MFTLRCLRFLHFFLSYLRFLKHFWRMENGLNTNVTWIVLSACDAMRYVFIQKNYFWLFHIDDIERTRSTEFTQFEFEFHSKCRRRIACDVELYSSAHSPWIIRCVLYIDLTCCLRHQKKNFFAFTHIVVYVLTLYSVFYFYLEIAKPPGLTNCKCVSISFGKCKWS